MDFQTLLTHERDGVLTVTLNRPDRLNALSATVLTELCELFDTLTADGAPRGVVLVGAGGRAFAAGADIAEMAAMSPDDGEEFGLLGQRATEAVEALPAPVVACVDGYALGGGCELAMAADFIYATTAAVFGQPEVSLGLIPGFGGCVRLPRIVGPGMAKELIYTGRTVDAAEASRIGLVNRVFDTRQEMLDAAEAALRQVATRSPVAVGLSKSAVNGAVGHPTADALGIERVAFRAAFTSADMREGTGAFLAKRVPSFPGK